MNFTFNTSSIVSVNAGTIVLNVSGKTRTFVDAKLISAVNGEIILDLPTPSSKRGNYITLVTKEGIERTFILSEIIGPKVYYCVSTHFLASGLNFSSFWYKQSNKYRNATSEEIQELNDRLASEGMCWNPDTMQIEELRWKPIKGTKYFHILIAGGEALVDHYLWTNDDVDRNYYKLGNCFKTREEAEAKLKQIKIILSEK